MRYCLLISESKCSWGARRVIKWTGFIWDTVRFQLSVSEAKIQKAEAKVGSLLEA